jgi:thiamine-monophosphate kinase
MPSEFEVIARFFTRPARTAVLGVGDDCALVRVPADLALAVTTDLLVEGTHFLPNSDARKLGHKSLAVNLSDLAAMGADPRWATLSLALPEVDESWLAGFADGLFNLADRFGVEVIGGDTTRGPLAVSITALGTLPPGLALRRDGARTDQDVWLSGATGDAALGLAHLRGRVRLSGAAARHCIARLDTPLPLVELGRALRGLASSLIDISDGLIADLGHILERSGTGAEVWLDALPQSRALAECPDAALARECLLCGGDDYELLFTAPQERRAAVLTLAADMGLPLTRIGRTVSGAPVVSVLDGARQPVSTGRGGYDHFRPS